MPRRELHLDLEAEAVWRVIDALRQMSPRETQVLQGVIDGKSTKQIASELGISARTVDVHRRTIGEKAGLPGQPSRLVAIMAYVLLVAGRAAELPGTGSERPASSSLGLRFVHDRRPQGER